MALTEPQTQTQTQPQSQAKTQPRAPQPRQTPLEARQAAQLAAAGRRDRQSAAGWLRSTLLLLAILAAYLGIHVVLKNTLWFYVGAAYAILVIGSATLARVFTARRWVPPIVSLAVSAIALTAGYAADTAILGLLPTASTLVRFGKVALQGWNSIAEQSVPAAPEFGVVFLLALLVIGCALVGDAALSARSPALTALPLLTLLAIPVAVRAGLADPFWFVVTALLYLAILRLWRRAASRAVTFAIAAAVLVGALIAPGFLPSVTPGQALGGAGVSTGINPLINLGDDLRRGEAVTAVTYTTTSGKGLYLRLATLDTFTGRSWSPAIVNSTDKNSVDAFPPPSGLHDDVDRVTRNASIKVGSIAGRWLPLPYPSQSVDGLTGHWYWEPQGLSARSTDAGVGGEEYDVKFLEVRPTLEQVEASLPNEASKSPYVAVPANLPEIISQTAHQVAAGKTTSYDMAIALQDYFQGPDFTYSEDAPVDQSYDGSGADIVATFLQKKAGYCVHFASAMAIMARTLGIPSRVAVGFQPGTAVVTGADAPSGASRQYKVTSHDLHAWPELYFDNVGWLRFEPTPGRGVIPDYSTAAATDDASTPQNGATTTPTAAATGKPNGGRPDNIDPTTGQPIGAGRSSNPLPLVLLVMLGILLAAAFAPALTRRVIRARRYRALRRGPDAAAAGWAELRDTARDHGWAAPDTETPRDFAERLAVVLVDDRDTIGVFRGDTEVSAFARPGSAAPSPAELTALRKAIARTESFRYRVRAALLPASLMTRFKWDPEA